ncbi:MAG: phosphopantothenate/pantothenate synthetase [Methanosarcinales archaeon]|nr:phosphopantothenate/pantothenate synthetase [Methanosarcinales archaeon]
MTDIPPDHPRYLSLMTRHRIVSGVEKGITSQEGLIAQGRGEAFDYLIGEETLPFAYASEYAASAMILLAKRGIISVNGNAAALIPAELVQLSEITGAPLEVNLFYRTEERVLKIIKHLQAHGAGQVLGAQPDASIPGLQSQRSKVCRDGIYSADVVFVPLEDGDRCEALMRMGKQVIAVDLNPLSRTAKQATISIVDNVVRAVPNMVKMVPKLKGKDKGYRHGVMMNFDNKKGLADAMDSISGHLIKID